MGEGDPHSATTLLRKRPNCDICAAVGLKTPASVDGRTRQGPWAYMCEMCYEHDGVGLGLGKGQRLIIDP